MTVSVSDVQTNTDQIVTLSATAAPDVPGTTASTVSLSATPANGDAPLNVALNATTSDRDPVTLLWSLGDGESVGNVTSLSHTYVKAGTYTVTVTASDGRGGQDSASRTVTVKAADEPGPGPVDSGTFKLDVKPNGSSWTVGGQQGVGEPLPLLQAVTP